jgi:hypothetical protein
MPSQADRRKGDRVRVILLTDDAENKQKAENDGLLVATGMLFLTASFDHPSDIVVYISTRVIL